MITPVVVSAPGGVGRSVQLPKSPKSNYRTLEVPAACYKYILYIRSSHTRKETLCYGFQQRWRRANRRLRAVTIMHRHFSFPQGLTMVRYFDRRDRLPLILPISVGYCPVPCIRQAPLVNTVTVLTSHVGCWQKVSACAMEGRYPRIMPDPLISEGPTAICQGLQVILYKYIILCTCSVAWLDAPTPCRQTPDPTFVGAFPHFLVSASALPTGGPDRPHTFRPPPTLALRRGSSDPLFLPILFLRASV